MKKLALGLAVGGLFAWQAGATIVYNTPSGLVPNQGGAFAGPWILGLDFTVNTGGSVDAIGAYTASGTFSGTVPVAIYNVDSGLQVAGTEVNFSGTMGTLIGQTRYVNIAPVYLAPGTYSVVAANYGVAGANDNWNAGVANIPPSGTSLVTFNTVGGALTDGSFRYDYGSGLAFPLSTVGSGAADPRWSAGSFDFAVPEASGFALAGVALLGLVYVGRVYSQKFKIA